MKKGYATGTGQQARYQYSGVSGKSFTPSKYATQNASLANDLSKQVGNIYSKLPAGYVPGAAKTIDFPYNPYRRFEMPQSSNAQHYFSFKAEQPSKAETALPVHGYVNRFAGDSYKNVTTSNKYKTAKFVPVQRLKIKKVNM